MAATRARGVPLQVTAVGASQPVAGAGDLTLTASGGSVAPFRYVVIYNDTATNDELIGFYDYGSDLTLANGESLLIDFSAANGMIQLS